MNRNPSEPMSDTKDDSDVEILEDCEESSPKPKLQIFDGNVVISQELTVEEVHSLLAQISSRLVANPADFPNLQASKDEGSEVEVVLEERRQPSTSSVVISVEEHDYSAGKGGGRNLEHMQIEPDKDGEPIKLPDNLESVPKAEHFPTQRHRWNTNEEIAAILISFDKHCEWQSKEVKIRPKSGSMLLYSRKKVRYRRDGYCWKKRKDGKTTREDHMKLKVQGTECIYGCYVHSAILPTFHRRCYWLLQNPDIVLVHYLNVPYPDDNKLAVIAPSLSLWGDKKEWTKEELVSQLKPMFYSEEEPDLNNELEITTAETVEAIVTQLMEKQRQARAATLNKQLECGCPDSTCADGKTCSHPMRRITAANVKQERQMDNNNQVSSTTGSGVLLSNNAHHQATIHHRVSGRADRVQHTGQTHQSPLVLSLGDGTGLSLSQIQAGTGLLILNSSASGNSTNQTTTQSVAMVTSFKCSSAPHQTPPLKQYHHPRNKVVVKQESMETNQSCCRQDNNAKLDESNGNVSSLGSNVYENSVFVQEKKALNNAPETPTKAMDTSEPNGETTLCLNAASGRDHSSYYNETLDLSQEDIQRTLSANMPLNCSSLTQHRYAGHIPTMTMITPLKRCRGRGSVHKSPSPHTTMVQEMSPMELMDSPPTVVDDDVFVNLDAFDMLGDFPELEVLDQSNHTSATSLTNDEPSCKEVKDESIGHRKDLRGGSASITDYSPEWAYTEGGVKVLVTGPWYSSSARYSVLFDSFPVPTSLVQSGVLRCYCPAHEVGLATLQVACEGFVISNSVMFEYKRPLQEDGVTLKEPKVEENENLLKFTLLQRLESVDSRLDIKQEPLNSDMSDSVSLREHGSKLEARLVRLCQDMTSRTWREVSGDSSEGERLGAGLRGMSLLHMAAWLGFTRLVCTLIHWRSENTSSLLEAEVDAMRRDDDGATPLMHACARGHRETSLVLYRWNRAAIKIHNNRGQSAVHLARGNGFTDLAGTLERLDAGLSELNSFGSSKSSPLVSPSESLASLTSTQSHDGVFLKPDPVAAVRTDRTDTLQYKPTEHRGLDLNSILGLGDLHRVVKRPSVDSGIHLGVSQTETAFTTSKPTLSSKTSAKLSRFDRSMSLPLHPPLLSDLLDSPLLPLSQASSGRRMDFALCEVAAAGPPSNSPLGDIDNFSEEETDISRSHVGEQDAQMLTLAEQIIAAIPDRIKIESEEMLVSPTREALPPSPLMEPLLGHTSPPPFHFEFSDHNYRYYDVATPSSSMSPASSSLQSPSPSFGLDSPSPPPTTQDFCEFFHASASMFENDFSNLTLSDREQRELYEAAKVIQKAYRSYKGRKKDMEQDKERAAAVLIQNYYRRYKQYAYFKQMTRAATVIQNTFRTYCEHKRFKKSQEAAVCIQNYYRHYKELGQSSPCTGFKRTYSQRRQHQAACKIQQFMRQSKNKLQRERALAAEREKPGARQYCQAVQQKLPFPISSDPNNRSCDRSPDKGAS